MRVSLSKIALIEKLICCPQLLAPEDSVLVESYRILDAGFESEIKHQKKTMELIIKSGRNELRQEMEQIHNELFDQKSKNIFRINILNIFHK